MIILWVDQPILIHPYVKKKSINLTSKEKVENNRNRPAIVALSHPCSKLPMAAAIATRTAPLIVSISFVINQPEKANKVAAYKYLTDRSAQSL